MDFTSRQLKAFVLVAQHHSFTRAAEKLLITPSGLSVLIRELENQLGYRLFDRTTRHVALTAHGSQLLAAARRALQEFDGVASRVGRTALDARNSLSVGAGLLMAANILPQAIQEFRSLQPDVRIQLFDAGPPTIMQRVRTGRLDLGLGFFKPAQGVRRIPFFRFPLMVIRPGTDASPRRASITWSALKGEQLVLQAPPIPVRELIDQHLRQAGVDTRRALSLNRLETVIAMVEAGAGTGIVPSFALPVCRRRNVLASQLTNPTVPVDFFQIRNPGRKLPPAAEEFTTFLQGYIARWAGRAGVL
jgi:DNA-binding transcriptional LysR family regulator